MLGQPIEVSCRMLWELFQTSHGTPLLLEGPIPCHFSLVTHGMSRHSVRILLVEAKEHWQRMPYSQWKCGVVKVHDVVLCACPCKGVRAKSSWLEDVGIRALMIYAHRKRTQLPNQSNHFQPFFFGHFGFMTIPLPSTVTKLPAGTSHHIL